MRREASPGAWRRAEHRWAGRAALRPAPTPRSPSFSARLLPSESLYENDKFPARPLVALVASKVFYHLGELPDALQYAFCAGELFEVNARSEFVDTLVAKCIDEYVKLRAQEDAGESVTIDERMVALVERMFERCFSNGE